MDRSAADWFAAKRLILPDGRRIDPDDVLGPAVPGTKYVHIGDVGRTENLLEICRDASTLVIESTYLEEEADMAQQFGHMTAAQAAHLAKDAGVKTLILTHLSRRYREQDIRNEARAIFPDTYVARDLDHFLISRDGARRQKKRCEDDSCRKKLDVVICGAGIAGIATAYFLTHAPWTYAMSSSSMIGRLSL